MDVTLIRLLVCLLCLSHLLTLIAVPVTRSANLRDESSQVDEISGSTQLGHDEHVEIMEEAAEERVDGATARRMEVEVTDYPGSGANNRHTPYPRPWRGGCTDC